MSVVVFTRWAVFAVALALILSACGGRGGLVETAEEVDTGQDTGTGIDTDTGPPPIPIRTLSPSSGGGSVKSANLRGRLSVGGSPKASATSTNLSAKIGVGTVSRPQKEGTP